jgi:signal transduction histidine kinase
MTVKGTARHTNDQARTHAFVNALSSVRSLADLLVEYPGMDAIDRSRFIGILRDETERLVRLIPHTNLSSDSAA